ncbi:hypothetical protein N8376_01065 [Flavobacteriaceae bacterium]|nr:hypothetical protein [Flavobacteriaceae bacterium]MDC1491932.1 hypothetical protein [Flavobacteriaceae bacterium]
MKEFILKYYPIIIAFIAMLYSIGLGILGFVFENPEYTQSAQYSAHWPGTILLFAIALRQRRTT